MRRIVMAVAMAMVMAAGAVLSGCAEGNPRIQHDQVVSRSESGRERVLAGKQEKVGEEIARLGSSDFEAREQAAANLGRLLSDFERVCDLDRLRQLSHRLEQARAASTDLEVRERLSQLLAPFAAGSFLGDLDLPGEPHDLQVVGNVVLVKGEGWIRGFRMEKIDRVTFFALDTLVDGGSIGFREDSKRLWVWRECEKRKTCRLEFFDLDNGEPLWGDQVSLPGLVQNTALSRRGLVAGGWKEGGAGWLGCYDASTGKPAWEAVALPAQVTGLWVHGPTILAQCSGDILAFDVDSGRMLWRRSGVFPWGEQGLRVHEGRLVVWTRPPDGVPGGIETIDLQTGETIWKKTQGDGLRGEVTGFSPMPGGILAWGIVRQKGRLSLPVWAGCYRLGDGGTRWEKTPEELPGIHYASLQVFGSRVFAWGHGEKGLQLGCFSAGNGGGAWQINLGERFADLSGLWVEKGRLFVWGKTQGEDGWVGVYETETGHAVWERKVPAEVYRLCCVGEHLVAFGTGGQGQAREGWLGSYAVRSGQVCYEQVVGMVPEWSRHLWIKGNLLFLVRGTMTEGIPQNRGRMAAEVDTSWSIRLSCFRGIGLED